MSIKEGSKRARAKSQKRDYPSGFVVPDSALRDFIESVGIEDIATVAARFQAVADLIKRALANDSDELDQSLLRLIKQVADESDDEQYEQLMRSIIAGVGHGRDGITAAHATASRVVQLGFRWTRDYLLALNRYRVKLRRMRACEEKPIIIYRGNG
ncbi:MAG TPA: hypothetical protein VNS63_26995 [Blastocatellia bacterium]|nr:hypothetical protein [Blastocatellia bacterium]